jgi:hypothetical protein
VHTFAFVFVAVTGGLEFELPPPPCPGPIASPAATPPIKNTTARIVLMTNSFFMARLPLTISGGVRFGKRRNKGAELRVHNLNANWHLFN